MKPYCKVFPYSYLFYCIVFPISCVCVSKLINRTGSESVAPSDVFRASQFMISCCGLKLLTTSSVNLYSDVQEPLLLSGSYDPDCVLSCDDLHCVCRSSTASATIWRWSTSRRRNEDSSPAQTAHARLLYLSIKRAVTAV